MASFKSIASFAPVIVRYQQTAAAGTSPDGYIFINPSNSKEYFEVVRVCEIHDVAGGSGAVADVVIVPSGTTLASGTTVLTADLDLTSTADTIVSATLTATKADRIVKPGDSIGIDTGGTLTNLVGMVVQVTLRPIRGQKVVF